MLRRLGRQTLRKQNYRHLSCEYMGQVSSHVPSCAPLSLLAACRRFVFSFELRSVDFLYISPCQSIRLTQTESQRPDGGLIRNLGARALLLMRGQASALEPLRTSRRGHQRRATRVSLARIVQQRRAHEPAHAPLESGARHSRDLRGGPRPISPRCAPDLAALFDAPSCTPSNRHVCSHRIYRSDAAVCS